ncbi:MAG: GntR family transcriptional regulator [Hyphomicrobiales bacterium]
MAKRAGGSQPTDVADLIAHDIQGGLLRPGAWLKQVDLQARYGCKRSVIRGALDRLAQKRVVRHIPNRGYHMFEPDGRQDAEIRELRVILETAAAEGVVASATPEAIARVGRLARRFAELVPHGTLLEQYEANIAFHVALLGLCTNRELVNVVMELRSRGSSAPAGQWKTKARIERSAREHLEMLAALEARDAAGLRRLIALHIRQPEALPSPRSREKV